VKVLSLKLNVLFILIIFSIVGEHEIIKQKIAAKILQKSNLKTKDLEDKVKREIRFSKYFRHPNIIRLYEVIETNSEIILIMEYAQGGELYDLICRERVIILL
jgi:5'-AMP-activated protein kinase catalytic alpha subunit